MADREPIETKNLDIYGFDAAPVEPAAGDLDRLHRPDGAIITWFLGTVGRDGRPHAAGVGAVLDDGDLYFTSGPARKKSK